MLLPSLPLPCHPAPALSIDFAALNPEVDFFKRKRPQRIPSVVSCNGKFNVYETRREELSLESRLRSRGCVFMKPVETGEQRAITKRAFKLRHTRHAYKMQVDTGLRK